MPVPLTPWALMGRAWSGSEREVLWEHFSPPEIAPARETSTLKYSLEEKIVLANEREARAVRNHEDIRR